MTAESFTVRVRLRGDADLLFPLTATYYEELLRGEQGCPRTVANWYRMQACPHDHDHNFGAACPELPA